MKLLAWPLHPSSDRGIHRCGWNVTGEPRLAWGFWNHCHNAYQETKPHAGYVTLKQMGSDRQEQVFGRCKIGSCWFQRFAVAVAVPIVKIMTLMPTLASSMSDLQLFGSWKSPFEPHLLYK
eukprot:symbB.v1.2.016162.t1/scaffold1225.1/size130771/7